jgi:hypothetical protein
MAAEDKVTVTGASGAQYEFEVYPWGTSFKPLGGVYLVLRKEPTGRYTILYIGQTGDLSERFDNHHKENCFTRNGKTHIAVRLEALESRRLTIESDLIRGINTTCNG